MVKGKVRVLEVDSESGNTVSRIMLQTGDLGKMMMIRTSFECSQKHWIRPVV